MSVISYDWLHVLDLTLVPDAVASALVELTAEGEDMFPGVDQDSRLRSAYVQFCELCRRHRIRSLHAPEVFKCNCSDLECP